MADNEMNASVIKGGETPIEICLSRRSTVGLRIETKVSPVIEEFMRSLGSGRHIAVETVARNWRPIDPAKPLLAYDMLEKLDPIMKGDVYYRIDQIGAPLIDRNSGPMPVVNLSFLRLVGLSEGAGVAFQIRGVYSPDGGRALRDLIQRAAYRFFIDYLRPVDFIIKISTQEVTHPTLTQPEAPYKIVGAL